MNIFVGNLAFDATEPDLKQLFEGFGNVLTAVIVMEKQKKSPKSRGFGFVDMPDEVQALAAIAALNGQEFMGRALNVNPARSKEEAQAARKLKISKQLKATPPVQRSPKEGIGQEKAWFSPVFRKPGTYKAGRRTHSYMKRKGLAGALPEAKPRKGFQDNPLRWRKKKDQVKPWQKNGRGTRPEEKPAPEAKPWKKSVRLAQKSEFKVSQTRQARKNRGHF
jgi:RNA recognition motif-containing protein